MWIDLKNDSCVDGVGAFGCVAEPRPCDWACWLATVLLFRAALAREEDDGDAAVFAKGAKGPSSREAEGEGLDKVLDMGLCTCGVPTALLIGPCPTGDCVSLPVVIFVSLPTELPVAGDGDDADGESAMGSVWGVSVTFPAEGSIAAVPVLENDGALVGADLTPVSCKVD